ncbi:MAG: Ig-like domain-containing protein [Armatimonadota bacterium]
MCPQTNRGFAVVLLFMLFLLTTNVYAAEPSWMTRLGTIGHAFSQKDGTHVYLDAVTVDKIRAKQTPPYLVIHECFSAQDRLTILAVPSLDLSLGQTIDVEGTLITLNDGQRAIADAKVYGYLSKDGKLLLHGPLIKGLLAPTPWQWKSELSATTDSKSLPDYSSILPKENGEPNATPLSGPVYYSSFDDLLSESAATDGALASFQCKPIIDTGSDQYGNYFVLGEDFSSDTLKVYCQAKATVGYRANKISGQMRFDGNAWVMCVDCGPGYDHQTYVGRTSIIQGSQVTANAVRVMYTGDPEESIPYAKTFADQTEVTITGKIVTASKTDFPGAIYVEEPDRSSGIRVLYSGTTYIPARGDIVDVTGDLATGDDGEREIDAGTTGVTFVQSGTVPNALGLMNRSLGGGDFNVYTPGITYPTGSGNGLHNKGLLVKTWGKVTTVDTDYFYLDDGTGFQDGSGNTGVKVSWDWPIGSKPTLVPPSVDWYVSVDGISSSETVTIDQQEELVRVLRPRQQDDLRVFNPQDTAYPDIEITNPSGSEVHKTVSATSMNVTGTATDAETCVVSVEVKIDSGEWQSATYNSVSHEWSYEWQNPQSGRIWARATDFAGHTSVVSRDVVLTSLVFVNGNLASSGDGSGWASGKKTITEALSMAASGCEVWVIAIPNGYYNERITVPNGVSLYGGFAGTETTRSQRNWNANVTIIDGNQAGTVVTLPASATSSTRVDGFTIRNGKATYTGGGIYCTSGSPVIANNTIKMNMAYSEGSTYGGGGIYISAGTPAIYNNKICGNSGCIGGGIYCGTSFAQIYNNTIVNNSGSEGGGISLGSSGSAAISNNIVAFNASGIYKSASGGSTTLRNNCLYGNGVYDYYGLSAGTGDISADPKLANVQYADLHIQPGSVCIDAGYDSAVQCSHDMDNQSRIQGSSVDIGADESNGTLWAVTTPKVVRVDRVSGSDYGTGRDGSTWAKAVQSVQRGIELAASGGEVWVKATATEYNGSYGRITNLRPYVYVYGGFAGSESVRSDRSWIANETILNGSQSGSPIVTSVGPGYGVSTVDGFKIYNGSASNGAGIYCDKYSSPILTNNNITENTSTNYGGGIYCNYSSPQIVNNKIVGNTANTGGGIYSLYGSTVITGNTIDDNSVSADAGGIYAKGRAVLIAKNTIKNHQYTGAYNAQGGGLWLESVRAATVKANRFDNNTDWYSGAAISLLNCTAASVVNNLFVENFAKNGGGGAIESVSSHPKIINNTFALNHTYGQGGAVGLWENDYSQPAQVINNIFYNNKADLSATGHSAYSAYSSYYVNLRYCDAYSDEGTGSSYHYGSNIYADSTCKYIDPDFCEVTGDNPYWLKPTSTVRGIGQNPSQNSLVPTVDKYDLPRPGEDGLTDPGPYEDGPFVRIANPQDGTMYGGDLEGIAITAETSGDASSVSYTATKVGDPNTTYDFGPVSAVPYRVIWSDPPNGCYELVATATFAGGVEVTSEPVLISIAGYCYPEDTEFEVISPYQTSSTMLMLASSSSPKWLKGAMHVHWYDDNGTWPPWKSIGTNSKKPAEVADMYEGMGYDFIAVTEHNHLTPPRGNCLGSDFVWLENCEELTPENASYKTWMNHVLAVGVNGKSCSGSKNYDISRDTVTAGHRYLKWKTPNSFLVSDYEFIPNSKDYDHVAGQEELLFHNVSRTGMFGTIADMGGLSFIPHPTASSPLALGEYTEDELVDIASTSAQNNRFLAIACYTNATPPDGGHWSNDDGWGHEHVIENINCRLVKKYPKRALPFTYSEEDYTPGLTEAGKSWIYLKVDDPGKYWDTASNHYRSERIKAALKKGVWWSCHTHHSATACSQLDVQVTGTTVTCTSSTAVQWFIRGPVSRGSRWCDIIAQSESATTSYATTLERCHMPDWIVVVAVEPQGFIAESQPIRLLPNTSSSLMSLATTSSGLVVKFLDPEDYPEEMPSTGLVGGIYDVSGDFEQGSTLTLSFAGVDVTELGVNNLRIFYYDPSTSTWSALSSTLDTANQEISAEISNLGIYAISAIEVTDTEAPTLSWLLPLSNALVSGAADLEVNAADNVGLSGVTFYISNGTRERTISADSTAADGRWGASVDFSNYVSGSYTLRAEARDRAGNTVSASLPISIQSSAVAPQVTISQTSYDTETSSVIVTGTASDADGAVAYVLVELDGQLVGTASLDGNSWTYALGSFGPGTHTVRAVAIDEYGNEGMQEVNAALSLSAVDMSADPDGTCLPNQSVTVTAEAIGGGTVEYRILVYDGVQWTVLQEYDTSNCCTWTPDTPCTYTLRVYAREQGTTYPEFSKDSEFIVTSALSGVTLSIEPSPRATGAPIRLYATATGGTNTEYKFEANNEVIQDWATADTCQWIPAETGNYTVTAYAREHDTTTPVYDDSVSNYVITSPVSAVSLGANPGSPQQINTPITLTATPTDGGTVEYFFEISDDGGETWSMLRNFDTDATFQWIPTSAGNYKLGVAAREAGTEEDDNPEAVIDYVVNP